MADSPLPTNSALSTEQPVLIDIAPQYAPANEGVSTQGDVGLEEDIEEELIIEDFTIDGICGVY